MENDMPSRMPKHIGIHNSIMRLEERLTDIGMTINAIKNGKDGLIGKANPEKPKQPSLEEFLNGEMSFVESLIDRASKLNEELNQLLF